MNSGNGNRYSLVTENKNDELRRNWAATVAVLFSNWLASALPRWLAGRWQQLTSQTAHNRSFRRRSMRQVGQIDSKKRLGRWASTPIYGSTQRVNIWWLPAVIIALVLEASALANGTEQNTRLYLFALVSLSRQNGLLDAAVINDCSSDRNASSR